MDINISFSCRLNELIKETGLAPSRISRESGVGLSELQHWKSVKNCKLPSTKNLIKLADYFSCSLSFILGLEEENSLPRPNKHLPDFADRLNFILKTKQVRFYLLKKTGKINFYSSLSNWKRGISLPNVFNLVVLSDLLDCSIDFLLGRES